MLVTGGVHDENETDEEGKAYDLASLTRQENEHALEKEKEQEEQEQTEMPEPEVTAEQEEAQPEEGTKTATVGTLYNLEELSDFDYLTSHFYTIEPEYLYYAGGTGCGDLII